MIRSGAFVAFWAAVLVLAAAAVPVVAGDPVEPLVEHVEEKAHEAQGDPVAFAENHTSEEALANETRWTRDYACFAAREAAKEAGEEPPDVGVCPAYEDAREEDFEEKDEAVADELGFDPVGEAGALVDDALGTVEEIADDPGGALAALVGFLERAVRAVERIVTGAVDFVKDLIGLSLSATLDGLLLAWDGLVWTASLPVVAGEWLFDTAVTGVEATWDATTGLAGDAADAVGKGVTALTESIQETVQSLFGTEGSSGRPTPDAEDTSEDVDRRADRLLDDVVDVVPDL